MSREVKRVPLGFDWPLNEVWGGYLMPDRLHESPCPDCENGYSPRAAYLHSLWYGYVPFQPEDNGSTPLNPATPAVRAFAERNTNHSPNYYGTGEAAIVREASRLATLWNGQLGHHLNQADVDALIAADRLMDFTHTWSPENRWRPRQPSVVPTAAQVNEWSLSGMGHDSINAMTVIEARCQREGVRYTCTTCEGHASIEACPGQRAEAEEWEQTEPPTGDGWQLWETTSEGSPISPVHATTDALARWMADNGHAADYATASRFIDAGWVPTFVGSPGTGLVSGVDFVGRDQHTR